MVERINGKTILTTPVSAEDLEGIKIGDIIYLNGSMTTCRDVAHRRVVEEGREIPVDVRNNAIFHAGPIIRPLENDKFEMVSVGPTTSMRMEKFEYEFVKETGVRVIIGKGGMKEKDSPVLGLHIEGPYLNPKMAGTQYDGFLKTPDENEYIPLLEHTSCIRRWDISPELHGAHDFAKYTRSKGVMTAVTHTEAEYDEIKAAYAVGFSHAAHFYNAMPGFHKRREYKYEGTVESVYLTDGMTVEVIADGIHLPATILKLVYKLKGVENTCLVTDALAYAAYEGNEPIDPRYIIEDGVCKMADHSALAGSLATMDVLVRTMVKKANIPLEDAVRMASETPARLIGASDRKGALAKGKDADIVILDKELNVRCVWSMGKIVPGTDILLHKE